MKKHITTQKDSCCNIGTYRVDENIRKISLDLDKLKEGFTDIVGFELRHKG